MFDHIMLVSLFHVTGAQPFFIDTFCLLEFYWKRTLYQRENFQTLDVSYVMFNFKFLSLTPIMILDVKNLGQAAQGMLL